MGNGTGSKHGIHLWCWEQFLSHAWSWQMLSIKDVLAESAGAIGICFYGYKSPNKLSASKLGENIKTWSPNLGW
jgi:hypothetical protein